MHTCVVAVLIVAVLVLAVRVYLRRDCRELLTPQDIAMMTPDQRATFDKESDALRNQGRYCRNWAFNPRGKIACASSVVNGRL